MSDRDRRRALPSAPLERGAGRDVQQLRAEVLGLKSRHKDLVKETKTFRTIINDICVAALRELGEDGPKLREAFVKLEEISRP